MRSSSAAPSRGTYSPGDMLCESGEPTRGRSFPMDEAMRHRLLGCRPVLVSCWLDGIEHAQAPVFVPGKSVLTTNGRCANKAYGSYGILVVVMVLIANRRFRVRFPTFWDLLDRPSVSRRGQRPLGRCPHRTRGSGHWSRTTWPIGEKFVLRLQKTAAGLSRGDGFRSARPSPRRPAAKATSGPRVRACAGRIAWTLFLCAVGCQRPHREQASRGFRRSGQHT